MNKNLNDVYEALKACSELMESAGALIKAADKEDIDQGHIDDLRAKYEALLH